MQSLPYPSNSSFITRHRSTRSLTTRVTKEQNDPYIPSRRRGSEYSVLVLIA